MDQGEVAGVALKRSKAYSVPMAAVGERRFLPDFFFAFRFLTFGFLAFTFLAFSFFALSFFAFSTSA